MCYYDIPLNLEDRTNLMYDLREGKITPDEFNRIIDLDKNFKSSLVEDFEHEHEPVPEKIIPGVTKPKTMFNEELEKTISLTDNEIKLIVDALNIFKGDINKITTNSSIAQCFTNSLVDNISMLLEKLYSKHNQRKLKEIIDNKDDLDETEQ